MGLTHKAACGPEEAAKVWAEADLLHSHHDCQLALDSMAEAITRDWGQVDPLVIGVMNGALIPLGHLLTRLDFPLELDYLHASRYRNQTQGDELAWYHEPKVSLQGRKVLLVDDILDEGLTLKAIKIWCEEQGAEEVRSAVLVEKKHDRNCGISAEYVGMSVEDRYVFGYGMDYKGYLRNADGIYAVKGL